MKRSLLICIAAFIGTAAFAQDIVVKVKNSAGEVDSTSYPVSVVKDITFFSGTYDENHAFTVSNTGVYDYLKADGKYKTFIRLLDDTDVLSEEEGVYYVVFAANDDAYAKYFAANNLTYDKLSSYQKSYLVNFSVIRSQQNLKEISDEGVRALALSSSLRNVTYLSSTDKGIPSSSAWQRFREASTGGVYVADDYSFGMDYVDADNGTITVNNALVTKCDIACKDGYVNEVSAVVVPQDNAFDLIRNNATTSIFSALLDNFCVPAYNSDLSSRFGSADSVFVKSYSSELNSYNLGSASGYMYAPSNSAIEKLFLPGGSAADIVDAYCSLPNTQENLLQNLLQIPYLSTFCNYWLSSSSPDVVDSMGINFYGKLSIVNTASLPEIFSTVFKPLYISDSLAISNWIVYADRSYASNVNSAPLGRWYNTTMSNVSNMAVFYPTDNAFTKYYDILSVGKSKPLALEFRYNRAAASPIQVSDWLYDLSTGEIDYSASAPGTVTSSSVYNRLAHIMDGLIINDPEVANSIEGSNNEYFKTSAGSYIKIERNGQSVVGGHVKGGWQMSHEGRPDENTASILSSTKTSNGYAYIINQLPEPTVKSAYTILSGDGAEENPYKAFFDLICQVDMEVLEMLGIDLRNDLSNYTIFTSSNGLDFNVSFFSGRDYTIYAPTNEAISEAISKGLPTWESIGAFLKDAQRMSEAEGDEDVLLRAKEEARAKIEYLKNFLKYHFQITSVVADNEPADAMSYPTFCYNAITNRICTLDVTPLGNKDLTVRDGAGNVRHITNLKNVMAHDMVFDRAGMSASTITKSSYSVIHQIDGVLNSAPLVNGRYESQW